MSVLIVLGMLVGVHASSGISVDWVDQMILDEYTKNPTTEEPQYVQNGQAEDGGAFGVTREKVVDDDSQRNSMNTNIFGLSLASVDADGPYGTQANPIFCGDTVAFTATIIGGDISSYDFRWDIDNDGFWDTSGVNGWGDNSMYAHTFANSYIGLARVEAWDYSVPFSPLSDTADVWVECGPPPTPGDLKDLIDSFGPDDFSNPNHQKTLINKVNAIINSLDPSDLGSVCDAIDKLAHDILPKTDGEHPPPDWVTDASAQQELEDMVNDVIDALQDAADDMGGCP